MKHLPHNDLKTLAAMCGGVALLVGVAVVLSGGAPFLSNSFRLALSQNINQAAAVTTFNSNGGTKCTQASPCTYQVPPGITKIAVTVVGGGGGGGGSGGNNGSGNNACSSGNSGAAGGAIANQFITVNPGDTYTIVAGVGGGGGASPGGCDTWSAGNSGNGSSFSGPGVTLAVTGGRGAPAGQGGNAAGGTPNPSPSATRTCVVWDGNNGNWNNYTTQQSNGCAGSIGGHDGGAGPDSGGTNGYGGGGGAGGYYLTNPNGKKGEDGYVTVNDSAVTISASPPAVAPGGSSVITWTEGAVDAYSCTVSGPSGNLFTSSSPVWAQRASAGARFWSTPAVSADGSHIAVAVHGGYIYTSTDGGASWTQQTNSGSRNWYSISSSADGSHIAAVVHGGYIYTSTDGGASWTQQTNSGSRNWYSISSSADGTKLAAVVGGSSSTQGDVWTSADGGVTWTDRTASGARIWDGIASSADGTKLVAVAFSSSGGIWISADSGATWSQTAGPGSWYSIAPSTFSTNLVAEQFGGTGEIYTSNNSGASWSARPSAGIRGWSGVASSLNGQYLAAVDNNGGDYVKVSSDYGTTWVQQTATGAQNWYYIGMSADGSKIVAIQHPNGYIYTDTTNYDPPSGQYTATNITPPQTYTISCRLSGQPVSASVTVTATSAPTPSVTFTANGVAGDITVIPGQTVHLVASYSPAGSYTGTAINDFRQLPLTSQDASTPKTYDFNNNPSNLPPPGDYSFTAAVQVAGSWNNNFGKTITVHVRAAPPSDICTDIPGTQSSVPSGCQTPTPSPGACIPSGYTYDAANNRCVANTCGNGLDYALYGPSCKCPVNQHQAGASCVVNSGSITQQLQANPNRVRKNGTATLSWATQGMTSCSLSQNGVVFNANAPLSSNNFTSPAIISATTFTLSCTDSSKTYTSGASVTILPSYIEI